MKNSVLRVFLLLALGITSCHQTAGLSPTPDSTSDPLKEHTQDLQQAKTWLPGRWKLTKVSVMIPNPTVPTVELVVDANHITLLQDGVQTDKVEYEIVKTDYNLLIKTNAQLRADDWYIRNPGLYMNQKRMYLDLGRAQDLPAYEFTRVN